MTILASRLRKLEAQLPPPSKEKRVIILSLEDSGRPGAHGHDQDKRCEVAAMTLTTRIAKLEGNLPQSDKPRRLIRLVTNDEEEAEALKLLDAEGYDPASGEIGCIRLIAVSAGASSVFRP
jgi:hypothetical protein